LHCIKDKLRFWRLNNFPKIPLLRSNSLNSNSCSPNSKMDGWCGGKNLEREVGYGWAEMGLIGRYPALPMSEGGTQNPYCL
jgi:hypothetical protein